MKQTNYEYLKQCSEDFRKKAYGDKWRTTAGNAEESLAQFADWLASPRTEPIVLTAEERKAAELAVAIGLPWIRKTQLITYISELDKMSPVFPICDIPNIKSLCGLLAPDGNCKPIDLRTLLKEGTI